MKKKPPSLFPVVTLNGRTISDGFHFEATEFCKKKIATDPACAGHYEKMQISGNAFFQCPFGFTTKSFDFEGEKYAVASVIAYPRYGTDNERKLAKTYSMSRCTRAAIDQSLLFITDVESVRAQAVAEATKFLPQAFHELRKFNAAIIQNTEMVIKTNGESRHLVSIKAAAELMRNNFDILEALSNLDVMRALPADSTVNVYDLSFKMKRIHQEKARTKKINISLEGSRAVIKGSQKSFPLVLAVLLENAIKYGNYNSTINIRISHSAGDVFVVFENETEEKIDPIQCFDRGVRFSKNTEGGGYGLFLAKEIVQAHKGAIWCETQKNYVRFTINLPLHAIAAHFTD